MNTFFSNFLKREGTSQQVLKPIYSGLLVCATVLTGLNAPLAQASQVDSNSPEEIVQNRKPVTLTGRVIDSQGDAVISASIYLKKDKTKGTLTDINGNFKLPGVVIGDVIVVSYVGMKTQVITVKDSKLTIVLQPSEELLEDVVVVGYGSARKISSTTASVVKVNAKDLESKPSPNVFDGLQGKVTGLQIFSGSGEPGQLMSMQLHGNGSLGLGSSPLYILDGMPVASGTIMALNPNDIESVQVLKDASATAIYGSRASNGVIFLTTKKGVASERANITLSAQYGLSSLASRKFYDGFLNSKDLMDYRVSIGMYSREGGDKILAKNPHNTNWTDYFYKDNAPVYNAAISASGGRGRTNYFLSGQHFYQEGLMSNSKYSKSNFRINLNTQLNKWITISSNNALYYDNSLSNHSGSDNGVGIFYTYEPWYSPYKEDGTPYWDEMIPGIKIYNPRYEEQNFPEIATTFEYIGSLQATITPFKGLTLTSRAGLDFSNYYYKYTKDPRYKGDPNNGARYDSYSRGIEWNITNTIEYNFRVAEDHDITILGGHEYNQYDGNDFYAYGWGLKDYRLLHLGNVTDPEKKDFGSSLSQYAYLSFFGRLSYGYQNKHFLDLTVRNDASSKFPKKHRNATFWSVGYKWNMDKEQWMENVDWINRLSFKASTGTAGNSSLGNYSYWALAAPSSDYQGEPSRAISTPGNPELTWETQQKTTVGFDGRFFDRLGFNIEYYHRLTTDMVMSVPYPYTSGISSNTKNVGTYLNQGIDIHFDLDIWKDRKGNLVNIYGNFNYNSDKIIKLFQGKDTWPMPKYFLMYRVGSPMTFMMPVFKEVDPKTGDPVWYQPGEDVGQVNKDPNKVVIGNDYNEDALMQNTGIRRNAPFNGGFGVYASYAGFFVQADFSFFLGKYIINNDRFFFENTRYFGNIHKEGLDYWKQPGDKVHLPDPKRYYIPSRFDTRMLEDASFMRLKNLTIGYNVPRSIIDKQGFFTSGKISLSGRNLLTFTKLVGPDPEADTNLTYGRNPATKQFMVSLELGF